jgi:hypothetical protein
MSGCHVMHLHRKMKGSVGCRRVKVADRLCILQMLAAGPKIT